MRSDEQNKPQLQFEDERPSPGLKPWVLPLAIASVAVIIFGLLFAYVNLTAGAGFALLGLFGVIAVGREAARSAGE